VNSANLINGRLPFGVAVGLCFLAFNACEYEVPITSSPTRKVNERLLGDWTSLDGKEKMKVRRLDDTIYIIYYDGDLFRAYHSDVAETPFVTVQDINSTDRKYAYVVWKLSDDDKALSLRSVNRKVIPKENKDSARIVGLLKNNLQNPELLGETIQFSKEK
jgi:lipopolysaccharide export LptBFGC system permease protein LptF